MARSAVLLKPNVANIVLFSFCEQKFVQHGPIMIAIDCNALSLLIFEEKWLNYASGPKSLPNSVSFWVPRLFNVCVRVFCVPNETILLVYIPAKIKMSFTQRCSSVYTTIFFRRIDKTNYLSNQTWAKCYHSRNKHTYIIGHYNPSVRFIDLVSHTTYVVCVNFIHKWRVLQF